MAEAELAIAWFPAMELEAALERWPDLIDWQFQNHADYSARIELELRRYALIGPVAVAPIRLDDFLPWCTVEGLDPATAESRAQYAAHLGRIGRVVSWPPERNGACWCASGQKYKWCCGRATSVT